MNSIIDIRVKKANKIYHEGDSITGTIVLQTPSEIKHDGITLTMEGQVNLQLSPRNVGIFEAFYNSVKPVQICLANVDVAGPGKIPAGKTDIPFEIPLLPRGNKTIYETYHGVFINIQYTLKCELKRGFLAKGLNKTAEFIVEYKPSSSAKAVPKKVDFTITPESLDGPRDLGTIPRFKISGTIDSVVCCINKPFTGQIKIEHTEIPIKSVELQLVRVETCGCAEGYAKDGLFQPPGEPYIERFRACAVAFKHAQGLEIVALLATAHARNRSMYGSPGGWNRPIEFHVIITEIQSIQIGEGNVAPNIYIPIYMIFPRLFTCPTLITTNFKVEFEVNIVIIFENDHLVSENFAIMLTRT